ncbi:MAG TPA: LmeA family phospholipid-binding protein [Chthonomonadales bacterium]|nr:LmeA family phospholipid-binding protein [Chthonomonadales bacterium]
MSDLAKGLALGFLALVTLHLSLEARFRREAADVVRSAFPEGGTIRVEDRPDGAFGMFGARLTDVDVYGTGLKSAGLPFRAVQGRGWSGSIRHLRFHLRNLQIGGIALERLDAEAPDVRFDVHDALFRGRLVIRSAGVGRASIQVSLAALASYATKRSGGSISNIRARALKGGLLISGAANLLGAKLEVRVLGALAQRDGRYLYLQHPDVSINGAAPPAALQQMILSKLDPLLDINRDFGLEGYLEISSVRVGDRSVYVEGTLTLPRVASKDRAHGHAAHTETAKEPLWKPA